MKAIIVHDIQVDPNQPRRSVEPKEIDELAQSIRLHGLQDPIVIYKSPEGSVIPYTLLHGERRLRATQSLNLDTINAIVVPPPNMPHLLQVVTFTQRVDLKPSERAKAFQEVLRKSETQTQAAALVGVDEGRFSKTLKLVRCIDAVLQLLDAKELTLETAYMLADQTPEKQEEILATLEGDITHKAVKELLHPSKRERTPATLVKQLRGIAKDLQALANLHVKVTPKGTKRLIQITARDEAEMTLIVEGLKKLRGQVD